MGTPSSEGGSLISMSEENKTIAGHLYQRVSVGDLDVIDEVISDAFVEHEVMPGLEPNKAGVRQMFEMFINAFEGAKFEVGDMIAEGDKVFALARMTGTHRAEFMGVPPSGRAIDVGVADFFRFADGQVIEHWGVMDTGAMMQQLAG
jgi:steroid delta-isomerase-like uncharacterized protein